jgi:hypothetical protein
MKVDIVNDTLALSLARAITARHFIFRLRFSKLFSSFVAELSHPRIFRTKALGIMRSPPDMRLVEYICPFWVVFLLLALGCYHVHEVLACELAADSKTYMRYEFRYPSSFEGLEFELPLQRFPVVTEFPTARFDE